MFPVSLTGDLGTPWHPCISDETQNYLRALAEANSSTHTTIHHYHSALAYFMTAPTYKFFTTQHVPVLPLQ